MFTNEKEITVVATMWKLNLQTSRWPHIVGCNMSHQPKHKNAFQIQLAFSWIMDVIRGLPAHPGGMVGGAVGVGGVVGSGVGSCTVRDKTKQNKKRKKKKMLSTYL